jgi:hypothetical protein
MARRLPQRLADPIFNFALRSGDESRATANPVARLALLTADGLCDFPPIRKPDRRRTRFSRPGARRACGPAREKHWPTTSDQLSARLTPAFLLLSSRGWPPEKICRLNTENTCQPVHNVNARSIYASLECADVGTINLGAVRQLLLRQALGLTELPQIECQYLSYLHGRESTVLKSISPRSILDKRGSTGELDWPQGPFSPPSGQSFERWSEQLAAIIISDGWSLRGLEYAKTMA